MRFYWPELDYSETKPIGSKLVGYSKNRRRPQYVVISQFEIDSYDKWEMYEPILKRALRL